MAKVGILGGGGWAIGLAILLHDNGSEVTMWSKIESEVELLRTERKNERCLPGIMLPEDVSVTGDLAEVTADKDILILAVASRFMRQTAASLRPYVKPGQILVDVAKGLESDTLLTMTQVIESELPDCRAAILSGPSHAEEVARRLPTTCVAGAADLETAKYIAGVFSSNVFRVYTSTDRIGIEIGGSVKNVIALAAGIADGLGYGDNTKAALITRGVAEMTRLGLAMGGQSATFAGLSGIGDLIVTCASMHSRNRRAGILIGQGKTADEAMKEVNMVVEGVYSAQAALELAEKYQVEMPIVEQVNRVLFESKNPKEAVYELMMRDTKQEA
ncbi:MAG: NAD(P)-dependent glycerol-3-phosphate dehydrogenase [Lachnospiraceae bacterium]|nr:NAD(P)-dependent glycerol-3-phosphate dehydrogenase [Lachnospiraceae bacterium]